MLLNCGVGEDLWESLGLQGDPTSQSQKKSVLNIHWKTEAEAETPVLWPPDVKNWLIEKTLMLGKIEGRRRRGWQRNEMVGWHHHLNGHAFEQALGVGDGQGGLACCSPWGCKELDMTEWLNQCHFDMFPHHSCFLGGIFLLSGGAESFTYLAGCSRLILHFPCHGLRNPGASQWTGWYLKTKI